MQRDERLRNITSTQSMELEIAVPREGPSGPLFALVIHREREAELALLVAGSPIVVGRDFPAEIRIRDGRISRQHARFSLADGGVKVEDLESHNGTWLNGRRVRSERFCEGDELRLGSAVVTLVRARSGTDQGALGDQVIRSPCMLELYALARRAAMTDAPVLVLGETGTGKEHLARTIHLESSRAREPFQSINCGAIPENLAASLFFGHERGAFTGADKRQAGVFEKAGGGTLFLDEVGELPLAMQAALLRVLETKTFSRVGSTEELQTQARIVAATHCDLPRMVAQGTLRQDFFYRLSVLTLEVPALRSRLDELEPLVESFLAVTRERWGVAVERVAPEAMARLRSYGWPGNIRQLRNAVERAALVASGPSVLVDDLPVYVLEPLPMPSPHPDVQPAPSPTGDVVGEGGLKLSLRDYETLLIQDALRRAGGNRRAAAKLLRMPLRTFFRRLRALSLTDSTVDANGTDPE
jgi:two-component system response regulator AtoC